MSATAILSHKTFSLCGHGDPYHDCQDLLYFGCKNEHGYFNEAKGKAYVKVVRRNCGRLECPKCLDKVTTNKARKIQKRLKAWKVDRLTIKHIIVSPNSKETKYMDYPDIKTKAYKLMKQCGVLGGVLIVHPFRCNDFHRYEKPGLHFHIIGYGNVRGNKVKEMFEKEKWIIKNKGKRKSTFITIKYILGHCGVSPKYKSINWFGCCSYNKLKVKDDEKIPGCPYCGEELFQMEYKNTDKPPDGDEFLDEPSNWKFIKSEYS